MLKYSAIGQGPAPTFQLAVIIIMSVGTIMGISAVIASIPTLYIKGLLVDIRGSSCYNNRCDFKSTLAKDVNCISDADCDNYRHAERTYCKGADRGVAAPATYIGLCSCNISKPHCDNNLIYNSRTVNCHSGDYDIGKQTCQCPSSYFGVDCRERSEAGASCLTDRDCSGGGKCEDYERLCVCMSNFAGKWCEKTQGKLDCRSSPCVGNSYCLEQELDYRCLCDPLTMGRHCEHQKDYNDCIKFKLCENGGRCSQIQGSIGFTCICNLGWYGTACQQRDVSRVKNNYCKAQFNKTTIVPDLSGSGNTTIDYSPTYQEIKASLPNNTWYLVASRNETWSGILACMNFTFTEQVSTATSTVFSVELKGFYGKYFKENRLSFVDVSDKQNGATPPNKLVLNIYDDLNTRDSIQGTGLHLFTYYYLKENAKLNIVVDIQNGYMFWYGCFNRMSAGVYDYTGIMDVTMVFSNKKGAVLNRTLRDMLMTRGLSAVKEIDKECRPILVDSKIIKSNPFWG